MAKMQHSLHTAPGHDADIHIYIRPYQCMLAGLECSSQSAQRGFG